MKHHFRVLILFAALAAVLAAANVAVASTNGVEKGKSHHDQVVAYWTPDRIANAKPREVTPTGLPDFVLPDKSTNGKGGGGNSGGGGGKPGGGSGGSTTVTGATWTGGGLVQKTTGKVLFTLPDGDYVCSGSVVTDSNSSVSLVLTAGHCVYDETNHVFAANWMFMPDFEAAPSTYNGSYNCGILPYGCWTASSLVTTSAWANGGGSLAGFNDDYAFAVIPPQTSGGQTLESAVGGSQNIAYNITEPTSIYAFGYPQASPYDGTALTYCAGTTVADGWGGTTDYGLNCDMTGGSSGGPWYSGFNTTTGSGDLVSVNSFKYLYGKYSKDMFGPYFDDYTMRTHDAAENATTNTLVN